jgi:hypothetical protein
VIRDRLFIREWPNGAFDVFTEPHPGASAYRLVPPQGRLVNACPARKSTTALAGHRCQLDEGHPPPHEAFGRTWEDEVEWTWGDDGE